MMRYKEIALKENTRFLPSGDTKKYFSNRTLNLLYNGKIISPVIFKDNVVNYKSNKDNQYSDLEIIAKLIDEGKIELEYFLYGSLDRNLSRTSDLLFNHCMKTANNTILFMLNLKKYQNPQTFKEMIPHAIPFIMAAMLHRIKNPEKIQDLPISPKYKRKVLNLVKKYQETDKKIDRLASRGSSSVAIASQIVNGISLVEPEKLMFYFADAIDSLESFPVEDQSNTDFMYQKAILNIATRLKFSDLVSIIKDEHFSYEHKDKYQELEQKISSKFKGQKEKRLASIDIQKQAFIEIALMSGIKKENFRVIKRHKSYSSTHEKLEKEKISLDEINDIFGWRIIFTHESDMYIFFKRIAQLTDLTRESKVGVIELEPLKMKYGEEQAQTIWNVLVNNGFVKTERTNKNRAVVKNIVIKEDHKLKKLLEEATGIRNGTLERFLVSLKISNLSSGKYSIRAYGKRGDKEFSVYKTLKHMGYNVTNRVNRYTSIHINIPIGRVITIKREGREFGFELLPGELQIRTEPMDTVATTGSAMHFGLYKGDSVKSENLAEFLTIFKNLKEEYSNTIVVTVNGKDISIKHGRDLKANLNDVLISNQLEKVNYFPVITAINSKPKMDGTIAKEDFKYLEDGYGLKTGIIFDSLDTYGFFYSHKLKNGRFKLFQFPTSSEIRENIDWSKVCKVKDVLLAESDIKDIIKSVTTIIKHSFDIKSNQKIEHGDNIEYENIKLPISFYFRSELKKIPGALLKYIHSIKNSPLYTGKYDSIVRKGKNQYLKLLPPPRRRNKKTDFSILNVVRIAYGQSWKNPPSQHWKNPEPIEANLYFALAAKLLDVRKIERQIHDLHRH